MHYIIVDTNIVYGNFYLESMDWKKLLWLNKWEQCEICVPKFVVDEIIKKYKECISKTINELKKVKEDVKRYRLSELNLGNLDKKKYVEKYENEMQKIIKNEKIRILPYPENKNYIKKISERYFQNIKPFDVNKPSFQDAIIWYSILDFVKNGTVDDKFYFITKNNKDFAEPKNENKFHQQLLNDLSEEEKKQVSLYHNIGVFYEKNQNLIDEYKEETQKEEKLLNLQKIVKEYIKCIYRFEDNINLKKIIIDENIVQDYIESDLLNSDFENDYGDVGWGEDAYIDELVLLDKETEIEFSEELKGYTTFETSAEIGYSVVTKNPLYEDSEDEEFLYESNHNKEYNLRIQLSFEINREILNQDESKEVVGEYIYFSDPEIWEV